MYIITGPTGGSVFNGARDRWVVEYHILLYIVIIYSIYHILLYVIYIYIITGPTGGLVFNGARDRWVVERGMEGGGRPVGRREPS